MSVIKTRKKNSKRKVNCWLVLLAVCAIRPTYLETCFFFFWLQSLRASGKSSTGKAYLDEESLAVRWTSCVWPLLYVYIHIQICVCPQNMCCYKYTQKKRVITSKSLEIEKCISSGGFSLFLSSLSAFYFLLFLSSLYSSFLNTFDIENCVREMEAYNIYKCFRHGVCCSMNCRVNSAQTLTHSRCRYTYIFICFLTPADVMSGELACVDGLVNVFVVFISLWKFHHVSMAIADTLSIKLGYYCEICVFCCCCLYSWLLLLFCVFFTVIGVNIWCGCQLIQYETMYVARFVY